MVQVFKYKMVWLDVGPQFTCINGGFCDPVIIRVQDPVHFVSSGVRS